MPRQRRLTFVAALRQWKKVYQGKQYYLGVGKSKTDWDSHNAAWKRWLELLPTLPVHSIETGSQASIDGYKGKYEHAPQLLVGQQERYLEHLGSQVELGQITYARFRQVKWSCDRLLAWIGKNKKAEHLGAEQITTNYYAHLARLVKEGKLAPRSGNALFADYKMFVEWLWRQKLNKEHILPELPRNLRFQKKFVVPRTEPKIFTDEQIKTLFDASSPHLKCYIALALNCGYRNIDILTLRQKHLQGSRIVRNRHKTGVPTNHLLWTTTSALIEQIRNPSTDPEAPLLTQPQGKGIRFYAKRKKDNYDVVKRIFTYARTKVFGKENPCPSFDCFRKTSATKIGRLEINNRLQTQQLFLGHSYRTLAETHYAQANYNDLDRALVLLGKQYDL